jgi:hypothetical protein
MDGCQHVCPTSIRPTAPPKPPSRLDGLSVGFSRRGGPHAVFSGHAQLPPDPSASRASVGECAAPHAATIHHDSSPRVGCSPPRAGPLTRVCCATAALAPSCRGHSASYRSKRASSETDRGSTAMVVKRMTRNDGNTHRNPTYRVCNLCSSAPVVRALGWTSMRPGVFTLNVACSWTAPITTVPHSSSSISRSQSHRSSSQHSLRFEPSGGASLTQLRCRTVARSPTHRSLPYDHQPAAANSAEGVHTTSLNPFRRAGFTRVTGRWMI